MSSEIIKLDVGGKIFKIKKDLLIMKSEFFENLFNDNIINSDEEIFIDRCPHIFKHVLGIIRNSNYQFPTEYKDELDYFLMKKESKPSISICVECGKDRGDYLITCKPCRINDFKKESEKYGKFCPQCGNNKETNHQYICSKCHIQNTNDKLLMNYKEKYYT